MRCNKIAILQLYICLLGYTFVKINYSNINDMKKISFVLAFIGLAAIGTVNAQSTTSKVVATDAAEKLVTTPVTETPAPAAKKSCCASKASASAKSCGGGEVTASAKACCSSHEKGTKCASSKAKEE